MVVHTLFSTWVRIFFVITAVNIPVFFWRFHAASHDQTTICSVITKSKLTSDWNIPTRRSLLSPLKSLTKFFMNFSQLEKSCNAYWSNKYSHYYIVDLKPTRRKNAPSIAKSQSNVYLCAKMLPSSSRRTTWPQKSVRTRAGRRKACVANLFVFANFLVDFLRNMDHNCP